MALVDSARALFMACCALVATLSCAYAQQAAGNIYTVANVRAEATAENAVEAKKQATLKAETQAFGTLLIRLTDFRTQGRIPEVSASDVERFVSEIGVRNEGVSGTSYVATFSVTFSARAIDNLLAQYGVVPIVERGPEILILPVYIEAGAARPSEHNPWHDALARLDLVHSLVPGRLAPVRSDITAAIANAYINSPSASLATLKSQYHTTQFVLAVAELDLGGEGLNIRLIGYDTLGQFTLQRKFHAKEGVDESLMTTAANLVFDTIQQRWKLTRVGASPVSSGPVGMSSASLVPVQVLAEYSGLKEWQAIRTKLQHIPGVQNWDLKAVNPRNAQIGFDFPGGPERLAEIAASQGLSMENTANGWIVKTR
jgi:hypothetical protein